MSAAKKVSLFWNGANQAVRIPKEFDLAGNQVMLRREGNMLILEPISQKSLLQVLLKLEPLSESLPEFEDALPRQVNL